MSGSISCLDKEVSLQNLASKSEQYAGNARRLLSVAPGCQWSNLPCVPFANRSSIRETESARVTFLFAAFKLAFFVPKHVFEFGTAQWYWSLAFHRQV